MWWKKGKKMYGPNPNIETLPVDPLAKIDETAITALIKKIAMVAVHRMKREIIGEGEEGIDRSVKKFRSTVARKAWNKSQQWCKWNESGPILMPDYCRMFYKKGKTEVMVMEYPPQTRLLRFHSSLAKNKSFADNSTHVEDRIYNYSLAMPYTVFIHRFKDGTYVDTYVAFNDRPLKRLEEKPLRPYLSNIDDTLKLCSGRDFDCRQLVKDNLVQQVAYVMSHFWQTVYSNEWGGHFWAYRSLETDSRLKDLESWQAASADNPLFVIEDVQWLPHSEDTFGDIIVRLFDGDDQIAQFQQDLFATVADELINEVSTTVNTAVNGVDSKIDSLVPELKLVFMNELRNILK